MAQPGTSPAWQALPGRRAWSQRLPESSTSRSRAFGASRPARTRTRASSRSRSVAKRASKPNATRAVAEALGATRRDKAVKQINAAIANVERQLAKETSEAQRNTLQDQLQGLDGPGRAGPKPAGGGAPGPGSLVSPQPRRNALLALIAALLIGAGLMVLVERFDRKLRKPEELEPLADVPLLGTIPYAAFPGGEPGPQTSEAFQTLRDSLTYFNINRDLTTLVWSARSRERARPPWSPTSRSPARAGKRVVAVDCDMRHPQLATRLGIDNSPGLSQVLMARLSSPHCTRSTGSMAACRYCRAARRLPILRSFSARRKWPRCSASSPTSTSSS